MAVQPTEIQLLRLLLEDNEVKINFLEELIEESIIARDYYEEIGVEEKKDIARKVDADLKACMEHLRKSKAEAEICLIKEHNLMLRRLIQAKEQTKEQEKVVIKEIKEVNK